MPEGMEFEIPQVIGRADWEKLTRSERLSLGKEIKRTPDAFGLVFLRKSPSNHAIYKRLVYTKSPLIGGLCCVSDLAF